MWFIQDVMGSERSLSGRQRAMLAWFLYNTVTISGYKQDKLHNLKEMQKEPANNCV